MEAARTTSQLGVAVGNGRGSVVRKYGRFEGEPAVMDYRFLYHHRDVYTIVTIATGGEDFDAASEAPLAALMEGIQLLDLTPWIVGPSAIRGVTLDDRPQGGGQGEKRTIERDAFTIVKPPEMNIVPVTGDGWNPRVSWEARSEDPLCYVYFDLRTIHVSKTAKAKDVEEKVAGDRAAHWETMMADADVTPRGKSLTFKTRWGRTRCVGYELRGTLDDRPVIELGYIFKKKKYWYVVRMQFGGEGARAHWKSLEKALARGLKV